jgi:hypothetical protein
MHLTTLIILTLLVAAFCIQRKIQYRRRNAAGLPLPAGPNGIPLLGNIFNFPKTEAWLMAAQWRKKYGDH